MEVALDLEGVLADIHGVFLEAYNSRFDAKFSRDDMNGWYLGRVREDFNARHNLSTDRVDPFIAGYRNWSGYVLVSEQIWRESPRDIPALFSHRPAIFDEPEIDIDIVTARKRVSDQIRTWLCLNGLTEGENYRSLEVASSKHRLDYDLFIDDKPALHQRLSNADKAGIVFDQPWNLSDPCGTSHRVGNFEGLRETMMSILNDHSAYGDGS